MRVASGTFGDEALFAPATVIFAVGGTTLALLILFLLSLPITVNAGILPDADLPRIQSKLLDRRVPRAVLARAILELPRTGDRLVHGRRVSGPGLSAALAEALAESRSWLQNSESAGSAIGIRTDATLPHSIVRRAIRAAEAAGARHVEFLVLDPRGLYGLVFVDLDCPLPELPVGADAQALVEAIARR